MVNESLARRFFRQKNPIGRRITIGKNQSRRDLQIVGVVRDAKYQRLQEPTRHMAYLPYSQLSEYIEGTNLFAEVRAAGAIGSIGDGIRSELRALAPHVPLRIETVTDRIRESLVKERVMAALASGLGIAALVLACAALYGLLAYAVSRHPKEIGVRIALGADRASVMRMVLRECVTLAAIGITVGLAASIAFSRFTRTLLYEVAPTDSVSLAAAGFIMLVVAGSAGFLPARRRWIPLWP